jgi:lipoprotein-releasing system permease protein
MSYVTFIARRYLRSKQRHGFLSLITMISVLGIVVGTAALIIALAMMKGFEVEVKTRIVGTTGHITIYHQFSDGITDWKEFERELAQSDHVVAVAPFVYYKAAISSADDNDGVIVRGIEPEKEAAVTNLAESMQYGDWRMEPDSAGSRPILLGLVLAERLNVITGDEVVLYSLRGEALQEGQPPRIMKFLVTGIFETGMYEYDASLCYIRLQDAQDLFLLPDRITGYQLKVDDWDNADRIADEMALELPPDLYATDWKKMHRNLFGWMEIEKRWALVALSLIIAVAAFNIISSLIMMVIDKRREIAVLKTLGVPSRGIGAIFRWQGAIIGMVGTVLGISIGLFACWLQRTFSLISLPPEIYFIDFLPVIVDPKDVLIVAVVSLAISWLATIYPARRASRLYPIEILRYE